MATFKCCVSGCKSTCSLAPSDDDRVAEALEERGWKVIGAHGDGKKAVVDKAHCPFHAGLSDSDDEEGESAESVPKAD